MQFFRVLLCVLFFAHAGMSVKETTPELCRTLHTAVAEGNVKAVIELLPKADADCRDDDGKTPLHVWARVGGSWHMFLLIYLKGSCTIDAKDKYGLTPFHVAAIHGQKSAIITLAMGGLPDNSADIHERTPDGSNALHLAIVSGVSAEVFAKLLSLRLRMNVADNQNRTPVQLADEYNRKDLIELMAKRDRK